MKVPKLVRIASVLAGTGLGLTLLIQLWFTPVLLTLFFGLAIPCSLASIVLFAYIVIRDLGARQVS